MLVDRKNSRSSCEGRGGTPQTAPHQLHLATWQVRLGETSNPLVVPFCTCSKCETSQEKQKEAVKLVLKSLSPTPMFQPRVGNVNLWSVCKPSSELHRFWLVNQIVARVAVDPVEAGRKRRRGGGRFPPTTIKFSRPWLFPAKFHGSVAKSEKKQQKSSGKSRAGCISQCGGVCVYSIVV